MSSANQVMAELESLGNPEIAKHSLRFFKTGIGEYGEGDQFIGIRVPEQRRIAKQYAALALKEIDKLINHPVHEYRLTGLLILVLQFSKTKDTAAQQDIVDFYLSHLKFINNWDLVDVSAPKILGIHLLNHPQKRSMLSTMVKSNNLWERRISILATLPLIKQGEFSELLTLAEILLTDTHDLIHKAAGWMLREIGKVDTAVLENFLDNHAKTMPRTMLRYAIERLEPTRRKHFMNL